MVYRDRTPEVIFTYPARNLEYVLMKKILKAMQTSKPRVVFFDGWKSGAVSRSGYSKTVHGLEDFFDIQQIDLKEGDSIPDRISVLIIAQPHELEPRQLYEISRAIYGGTPTIFLVSRYSADRSAGAGEHGLPVTVLRPNLDDLFADWGVTLGRDLLASRDCSSGPPAGEAGQAAGGARMPLPILVKASVQRGHPLMIRTATLVFPATVGLTIDRKAARATGIQITELADSGCESYPVVEGPDANAALLDQRELRERSERQDEFVDPRPLAVLLEGSFPSRFDRESPARRTEN